VSENGKYQHVNFTASLPGKRRRAMNNRI